MSDEKKLDKRQGPERGVLVVMLRERMWFRGKANGPGRGGVEAGIEKRPVRVTDLMEAPLQ